jgi:micrococcal nuclease
VTAEAVQKKWTRDQLRDEIKKRNAANNELPKPTPEVDLGSETLPVIQPGKLGTYRYVKATVGPETGRNVIDLGFSNYYRTSKDLGFKEGAILEALAAFPDGSSPSDKIRLSKRTGADLYTYRAWIVNVLDGDTVKAVIDLGFGVRSVQVLRLRGIDAPELVSQEGKEAKQALEAMLQRADSSKPIADSKTGVPVLIKTVKSDKYDRYLADIFIADKKGNEIYLNNELLKQGLAIRVNE